MRLSTLALLAVVPAGADALCAFCPDGLMVDASTAVPNTGGETCGSLLSFAPSLGPDEYMCTIAQESVGICCPEGTARQGGDGTLPGDTPAPAAPLETAQPNAAPMDTLSPVAPAMDTPAPVAPGTDTAAPVLAEVQTPCAVCPDGLTADGATSAGGGGRTCASLITDAANTDASDAECSQMQAVADSTCCPPLPENPCAFCADGVTAEGDANCEGLVAEAALTDAADGQCATIQASEEQCCPAPAENPCQVCVDGVTADAATSITNTKTCGDLLPDALLVEDTDPICAQMKNSEATCCPTAAEVPCPVCPNGVTVDGTTTTVQGKTCEDLAADALNTEETDALCTTLLGLQAICCPTPCSFCGNNTLLTDVEVGRDTCGELAEEALTFDATSQDCTDLLASEATCCPALAVSPCQVCVDGITVENPEDVEAGAQGKTCNDLLTDALYVEATDANGAASATCTAMQGAESLCCPTPCSFCANATLLTDVEVDNDTCGELAEEALTVDVASQECADLLASEATCCPVVPTLAPTALNVTTGAPTAAPIPNTIAPTVASTQDDLETPSPSMASTSLAEGISMTMSPTLPTLTAPPTPSPVAPTTPSPVAAGMPSGMQFDDGSAPPSGGVMASSLGSVLAFVVTSVWAVAFF